MAHCIRERPFTRITQIVGVGIELLTQQELMNMFLTKDNYERTVWHVASEKGTLKFYTNCGSGEK